MIKNESTSRLKNFSFPKDILNEIEVVKAQLKEEDSFKNTEEEKKQIDDELDFRFTALTQGLGFHQEEKNKIIEIDPIRSANKPMLKSTTMYNQNVSLKKEFDSVDRGDLSPLYNTQGTNKLDTHPLFSHTQFAGLKDESKLQTQKNKIIENFKLETEVEKNVAPLKDQLFAWAIDLGVIILMLSLAITVTFATLGVTDIKFISSLFTASEAATYIAPFFVFFYLFYFTILDREGNLTLGKKLLRIRIIAKYDDRLGLTQSFLRAAITLLSSLALGLPLLMDFQGKLTDSMVIKEDY
ncbi:MAG: RDD family protein [Bacteriovoracaceae bacterium]